MLWSTHYLDFEFEDKSIPKSTWEVIYDDLQSKAIDMPEDMTEEDIIEHLSKYYHIKVKRWDLRRTPQKEFEYFTIDEDWSL
jgi:hypothetical protein